MLNSDAIAAKKTIVQNGEVSHYDIKSFKNIKAGFLLFDTQFSWKNDFWKQLGRRIIKTTTGDNIEHIAIVIKVPPEFIGMQYEDRYNGRDVIDKGYMLFEATKHYDSIATSLIKRMLRPSLSDLDEKGDSEWTGNVLLQPIISNKITDEAWSLAFQSMLDLTNRKPWVNGFPSLYKLFRAELSPFGFAKSLNKLLGYKELTPSVFCSVHARYCAEILTGQIQSPEEFNLLEGLGTNPKDESRRCMSKGLSKVPVVFAKYENGVPVAINEDYVIANPYYK